MRKRPIHKLAIRGSVRQLHAFEVCLGRYVGLFGAIVGSSWIFWHSSRSGVAWIAFLAIVAALVALFGPWHRELHVSMDSPVLRLRRVALGIVPIGGTDHALEGRRLSVERREVQCVPENDYLGCLTFFLPFPFNWLVSGARSSSDQPTNETHWALCLRRRGAGVEDLVLLKRAGVAQAFLDAAREIVPAHVAPDQSSSASSPPSSPP